jgi:hypothetical protein
MIRFRKSLSKPITLDSVALADKYIEPERDSQHGLDIGAYDSRPMTGLHATRISGSSDDISIHRFPVQLERI